ncbi:hypothetical protein SAMN06272775_0014 [Streptomyces sp. 2323.1]|uniref:pentapeptide repeat-containing protein n=1 Tax=Streptomyces sp. 2323.1 TaxID=1938841 RepID=UPI000BC0B7B2|nr:hypothetical protein [Streptomyces sp. 2323.1]SOE08934.1 hypothetical protein SAMN06272775_0014 [Streptomyces sp. 2323.1]
MLDAMPTPLHRQQPQGRHTPNLWSVWFVAPVVFIIVGALAYGLYRGAEALLTAENRTGKPVDVNDVIKTTVTLITLIGAVLAGIYAYRKQLLAEGDSHRADASQLAERYSTASEQLGHEQAAVRLAGVYAMARLADDWPEQRQVCIDVLCAYLRMPYETDPTPTGFKAGEREVRLTIIRIIRNHLQDPIAPTTWCGADLDFTGATFDGGDFYRAQFTGGSVDFEGVQFTDGAFFYCAQFTGSRVVFDCARFINGLVTFNDAQFTDGLITFVNAEFASPRVTFERAQFAGGEVSFLFARFTRAEVTFRQAQVTDGTVTFEGVRVESAADIDWGPFPMIPPRD